MGMKEVRIGIILCAICVINSACSISEKTSMQTTLPPSSQSNPSVPSLPTETANPGVSRILDYEGDPLYGLVNLQRAFSPDPHIVGVGAGGTFDTSSMNLACGFTTDSPIFAFNLSGGAEEGFLRIYFVSSNKGMDTKLIVHTPNLEWICKDNSSNGGGAGPIIDFEYAASGKYAVWVGMPESDVYAPGMLYITESANNTP